MGCDPRECHASTRLTLSINVRLLYTRFFAHCELSYGVLSINEVGRRSYGRVRTKGGSEEEEEEEEETLFVNGIVTVGAV